MRQVPHPLFVIKADDVEDAYQDGNGLLVSSFNTVAIHPQPMVSFNIKVPSATYNAIESSRLFSASSVSSVDIAKAFAKGVRERALINGCGGNDVTDATNLVHDMIVTEGVALFTMKCRWMETQSSRVGDHMIMVGKVLRLEEHGISEGQGTLIYSDGQYRYAGQPVD